MLRDKSLIPLSRQHQHALALCVRIERASPIADSELGAWEAEIRQLFAQEINIHFAAEEAVLFPVTRKFAELSALVEELSSEHTVLRQDFAQAEAGSLSAEGLRRFAERLSAHIRKEERQLFQSAQELMNAEQLATLGRQLEDALKDTAQACNVPAEAAKLRPAR
jgi:hemerythrin-like domain-containing protein